jgi:hypothetical protein
VPWQTGGLSKVPPGPQQGRLASWCRGSAHARDRVARAVQTLVVWWSIRGGVHVAPHSHPNEQIVRMLKGKMRTAGLRPGRCRGHSGKSDHEAWFREDTEVIASARGLSTRRQTRLHEQGLNSPLRLLSPSERAHVQFAPRCAPRCERGSSLESKHRCRLGGDCANLFRPPRADDHRVTSNRSSEGNAHWRKVGDGAQTNRVDAAKLLKPLALPRGLEAPHPKIDRPPPREKELLSARLAS